MSLKWLVMAGLATTALSGATLAGDTYRCGEQICYDDQADETRRLNEQQLENPGAGADAVPPARDEDDYGGADDVGEDPEADGQGGPYDDGEPPPDAYGPTDDDAYGEDPAEDDYDDEYPPDDEDTDGDGPPDDEPYQPD